MTWIAGGVFVPMIHLLDDDAHTMLLDRRRYWWSICNLACIALPPDLDLDHAGLPWCPNCFPTQAAIDQARQQRTTA